VYLFDWLGQVREITDAWLETYNAERPMRSLGQVLPLVFPRSPTSRRSLFSQCLLDGEAYDGCSAIVG
jgi:hypothetical protein